MKANLGSHVLGFLTEVTAKQRGTGTALPCVLRRKFKNDAAGATYRYRKCVRVTSSNLQKTKWREMIHPGQSKEKKKNLAR